MAAERDGARDDFGSGGALPPPACARSDLGCGRTAGLRSGLAALFFMRAIPASESEGKHSVRGNHFVVFVQRAIAFSCVFPAPAPIMAAIWRDCSVCVHQKMGTLGRVGRFAFGWNTLVEVMS
jgi:hypothetical protein